MKYTFLVKCLTHCGTELHGRLIIIQTNVLKIAETETTELTHFPPGKQVFFSRKETTSSIFLVANLASIDEDTLTKYQSATAEHKHPADLLNVDYLYTFSNQS